MLFVSHSQSDSPGLLLPVRTLLTEFQIPYECFADEANQGKEVSFDVKEQARPKNKDLMVAVGKVKFSIATKQCVILSNRDYSAFYQMLVADEMAMVQKLASVAHNDAKHTADCMVRAFEKKGTRSGLLLVLVLFLVSVRFQFRFWFRLVSVRFLSFLSFFPFFFRRN
jgi:hypothetical protein